MKRLRVAWSFVQHHPWMTVLGAVPLVAIVGFGVVAAGLVPITASSGHWPITEWFLHFAMRRSVVTHALLIEEPGELDRPALVVRGAGHYETGCRECHGAPGDRLPPVPHAMTPHPPELASRVPTWRARELFYIVRHGVKFTGMPAWPAAGRDDEVWAVVAFLRQLPGMSITQYRALALGADNASADAENPDVPPVVSEHCARCHGTDGGGRDGAYPKLSGQRLGYLVRALERYAGGGRQSGMMEPVAATLTENQRVEAARFYAALPPPQPVPAHDPDVLAHGEQLVRLGHPPRGIPACADCHLPAGERVNDAYPMLAGQYPDYMVNQLLLMQARARGGSEYLHLMHEFVDDLDRDQMEAAATYLAAQSARSQ